MNRAALTFLAVAMIAAGQQPGISNSKLVVSPAASGLEATVRKLVSQTSGPAWFGYAVPAAAGTRDSCCWSNGSAGCGLEGRNRVQVGQRTGPVKLEGSREVAVLLRFEQGAIQKIHAFSMSCPLDGGGLPFHWLTGVRPAESVRYLMQQITPNDSKGGRVAEGALHAIATHEGAEAEQALERLAAPSSDRELRKKAAFWLANSRGRRGYEVVSRMLREDPDEKVRAHAIFSLTLSQETWSPVRPICSIERPGS